MTATIRLQEIDPSQPGNAARIHAVQMAAYAKEAALIGARHFPPLERTVEQVASDRGQCFGAFAGEALVGVIVVETDGQGGLGMSSLVVAPEWQRRGVGRQLLAHVVHCHGAAALEVQTAARNAPALSLYSSHGFVAVRRWIIGSPGLELVRLRRPPSAAQ